MKKESPIHIFSEIGVLESIILHRPGKEIENMTPDMLERLLFDDIPFMEVARKEHDAFAAILEKKGIAVHYLEDLAAKAVQNQDVCSAFIDQFIKEAQVSSAYRQAQLQEYLFSFPDRRQMIDKMMEGIRFEELPKSQGNSLSDLIASDYPFITDPMPNLYFTRDPFATIGQGVSLNHMHRLTRNRETLFGKYIFSHHPMFSNSEIPFWYEREEDFDLEGGDILVLSDKVLAVGISERTQARAVEALAHRLLEEQNSFETVLAFHIPNKRAFMHLDTVFTMVDFNTFTIHPEIEGPLSIYALRRGNDRELKISEEKDILEVVLARYLETDKVQLIRCGGTDPIAAAREQWNDGSNTLAIAPGEVVVYERNHVTNRLLEEAGITLYKMPSAELSRGRGGPRCMSMPLSRKSI